MVKPYRNWNIHPSILKVIIKNKLFKVYNLKINKKLILIQKYKKTFFSIDKSWMAKFNTLN